MVILRLQGGLGNQLFQYALYRQLAGTTGRTVKIDEVSGFVGDAQRRPCLKELPGVTYETATAREVDELRDAFMDPVNRIRRKITGRHNKEWGEPDGRFYPEVLSMEDAYLNGYFQSERYFPDAEVRTELAEIFDGAISRYRGGTSGQMADCFIEAADRIIADGERSVSLHIRRGDYLQPGTAETHGGICTERYYETAVDRVRQQVPDAVFFVFSDDAAYAADWAGKKNAEGAGEFRVIEVLAPTDPAQDVQSLLLMRLCRHHVLANSSFSWWGAWHTGEGLVLVPSRWFNNRADDAIYTDRMSKIEC